MEENYRTSLSKITLNNLDTETFIQALDSCKGDVYLIDDDGNKLNLKSKLCQLIGVMSIINKGGHLENAVIQCSNKEDESKLFRLNLFGKE